MALRDKCASYKEFTDSVKRRLISAEEYPDVTGFISFEFYKKSTMPNIDVPRGEGVDSSAFMSSIKFLLKKVPFDISFDDVLAYEYNDSYRGVVPYSNLPIAHECYGDSVKYYWKYLNQTKLGDYIISYLTNHQLSTSVYDAYIIYYFKSNKLQKIRLRLFYDPKLNPKFPALLISELSNGSVKNDHSQEMVNIHSTPRTHYMVGSSYKDIGSIEIDLANENGYNDCLNDWWHN
jgi:hypothetical protein